MSLKDDAEGNTIATIKVGGSEFRFGKLHMRDLASIQAKMNDPSASFSDVYTFCTSPAGRIAVVVASGQKFDAMMTDGWTDDVHIDEMYDLSQKINVVSFRSLLTGKAGSAEGKAESQTGPPKPPG